MSSDLTWEFGDLSGLDQWLATNPDAWQCDVVLTWIHGLQERPWRAPSWPVALDPPSFQYEVRTAVLPDADGVAIDYSSTICMA